jgi:hypothetical protein
MMILQMAMADLATKTLDEDIKKSWSDWRTSLTT